MQQPPAAQSSPPCHDVAANQRVEETNTQGDHMDASESNTNTEHPLWSQIVQQDFPYHDVVAEHPEHPSSSTQCHAVTAGNTTSVVDQKGDHMDASESNTNTEHPLWSQIVQQDFPYHDVHPPCFEAQRLLRHRLRRNSSTASHWSQEKSIVGKGWTVPSYTKQKFHDGIVDDARALFDVTLQSVERTSRNHQYLRMKCFTCLGVTGVVGQNQIEFESSRGLPPPFSCQNSFQQGKADQSIDWHMGIHYADWNAVRMLP
ncbi:unnamed protein product [Heligmosomoides polygyrus]|uniref:CACTA en-spm transposon protein n=1 Tax=Heligmosomoides polygyrus TaxID=6339 RepID=A0A183GKP2_HELPZ|nr:unnamed protein product [Heligmosomoides polygyrus]